MKRINSQVARLFTIALAVAGLIAIQVFHASVTRPVGASNNTGLPVEKKMPETDKAKLLENYGKLPLSFEPNQGQADSAVRFLSRGSGYTLFLTGNEAVMALRNSEKQNGFLKLKLVGANAAPQIAGQDQFEGKSNYLLGNDQSKWQTDVPTFGKVRYSEIWPGVDMVWYGNQRTLEYDFIVKPGVSHQQISLLFEGAESLRLDAEGNLLLKTKAGELTQKAPVVYQDTEQGRKTIAGKYLLKGQNEVGFEIGAYDASRPLVIDPQLLYSTYVGGNNSETAFGVAVTSNGQAFITGGTFSVNFPVSTTADPEALIGADVAFVTKLNATGTNVIYSTILGGTCGLNGTCGLQPFGGVAVTSDGKAAITGGLVNDGNKSNYPVTDNAFQKNGVACIGDCGLRNARGNDIFVTMLNVQGNGLVYSTFYGGWSVLAGYLSNEAGNGIALDSSGRIYITGLTESNNLPMKNGFQNNPNSSLGGDDAFIAVFNPFLSNGNDTLVYASYLGGSGDEIGKGIAVDGAGNAYIGGETKSDDLATKAPAGQSLPPLRAQFQGGTTDGFVAKIDPDASGASSLTYLTYFGGSGSDRVEGIAVDANQRAYITGATSSSPQTFPLRNPFDNVQNNGEAFVSKLNADGTALFYSSFLGGTNATSGGGGFEEGLGIRIDAAGNAYVTGRTSAGATFPVGAAAPPFPANLQGTAFIAKIEASVSTTVAPKLLYSTTFGGAGTVARDVALDPAGNVYLTGFSDGNLPTTPGVFQPTFNGGGSDAFVAKIASTFNDTVGVFRASTTDFLLRNSNTTGAPDITVNFGLPGDLAVTGDWDGDGDDEPGVFRPGSGQFILRRNTSNFCFPPFCNPATVTITMLFGQAGDLPVVGDWNGDGIDTVGVYRVINGNGTWLLSNSPNVDGTAPQVDVPQFAFGLAGQLPVAGDWNGDGFDTVGVFQGGGQFAITNRLLNFDPAEAVFFIVQGGVGLPVAGDWDGDGVDTTGFFNNGVFQLRNSNTTGVINLTFSFGAAGDQPIVGDWNRSPLG